MADGKSYRKWGYRKNGKDVESKVFDTVDGKLPNGWRDSPAGLQESKEADEA